VGVAGPLILPTFFIIGASKAGTTSLHNYLAEHPEIAMAEPKEPHLMLGPDWRERVAGYERLFRAPAGLRGDCSPRYTVYPKIPHASEHIAELVPDARLIYLVRDPIERTIAVYAQSVVHAEERRPVEDAVRPEEPESYYMTGSRYATQVEVYLRRFDTDQLLVIDQAELRDNRAETLRRAFEHVGADPDFWHESFAREYNVRGEAVKLGDTGMRLKHSGLNRLSRRWLPSGRRRRIMSVARRALGRRSEKDLRPEVSAELRARLAEALAPEAERLRAITGQSFSTWSV
jgi:hypothetical protein